MGNESLCREVERTEDVLKPVCTSVLVRCRVVFPANPGGCIYLTAKLMDLLSLNLCVGLKGWPYCLFGNIFYLENEREKS